MKYLANSKLNPNFKSATDPIMTNILEVMHEYDGGCGINALHYCNNIVFVVVVNTSSRYFCFYEETIQFHFQTQTLSSTNTFFLS